MHDALILAAGGSRRLGQPKQLLTRHGETLLARTVRLVLATRPSRTVVVLGAHADELRATLDGLGVEVAVNAAWATGMASSLQCGAALLSGRPHPVLVTVVDQPALSVRHFDALLSKLDASSGASSDVVTAYGDAVGVPVVLRPATLGRAATLSGDEGFRRLWGSETPTRVRADDLGADVDTPEDVQRAVLAGHLDPM